MPVPRLLDRRQSAQPYDKRAVYALKPVLPFVSAIARLHAELVLAVWSRRRRKFFASRFPAYVDGG